MIETKALDELLRQSISIRSDVNFIRNPARQMDLDDDPNSRLRYDFDFVRSHTGHGVVATFRDPEVVLALQTTDPRAARLLEKCGFVIMSYESGVPAGHYLPQTAELRETLIDNLNESLAEKHEKPINWGRFDFAQFVSAIEHAKPLEDMRLVVQPISLRQKVMQEKRLKQDAKRKRLLSLAGLIVGLAMVGYAFTMMSGF